MPRKPSGPRAVLSVSVPIEPDWTRANRAAGMKGESLAAFVREAMRQRANRILRREAADESPLSDAA